MQTLFTAIASAHRRGEDFALCTVIESFGSAPRGCGAMMAVFLDKATAGTVGGGTIEHETILLAEAALREKTCITRQFVLSPNAAADIGMICGGNVTVFVCPVSGSDVRFSALLHTLLPQLACRTDSRLLLYMDGTFDLWIDGKGLLFGGDAAFAEQLPHLGARPTLLRDAAAEPKIFLQPLTHAQTVYVFGGGHVAAELVPLLSRTGFSVSVFEDREEFCSAERFPTAQDTILGDFSDIGKSIAVTDSDLLVIMTRGHQSDYEVLHQALRTSAAYIGVIGSRKKVAATRERLLADGFTETALARIHSPIGLAIRAETPAEIAVSIAAELILQRAELRDAEQG